MHDAINQGSMNRKPIKLQNETALQVSGSTLDARGAFCIVGVSMRAGAFHDQSSKFIK